MRIHPEMQSRRGGTQRHTNRRHPQAQPQAQGNTPNLRHAPPEGHTPTLNGDVCSGAGGRESAPQSSKNHLRAPSRVSQPAQAGEDFPSASLNKGPPAFGVRLSLCVRPPGLRPAASRLRRPSLPSGSRSEGMVPAAPCGTNPLPPAVPPCLAREPSTEHPQVLSSLLIPLGGKLSPSGPDARQPGPAGPPQRRHGGGSYLRPRGFAEPLPLAGLSPLSARAPQPRPPLQPLLALPLPRKPPPPPSRQPTSTVHMAPRNQWTTLPSWSPSRVPSPFPS